MKIIAHLPEIIADIKHGRVKPEHREALVQIVESWQRTYVARASIISSARQDRSDRIRQAVKEAARRTMQERPGLSLKEASGIVRRRAWASLKASAPLSRCPCTRTVKSELQPYFEKTDTYGATNSNRAGYASSMYSTSLST